MIIIDIILNNLTFVRSIDLNLNKWISGEGRGRGGGGGKKSIDVYDRLFVKEREKKVK